VDRRSGRENLPNSFPQFLTRLLGQTTMHLSIVPFPETGDCFNNVHIKAIHCRVLPVQTKSSGISRRPSSDKEVWLEHLPRPISSAMMQPKASFASKPVVHLYKNCTNRCIRQSGQSSVLATLAAHLDALYLMGSQLARQSRINHNRYLVVFLLDHLV
jgi:hypothetical protein